jgi:NAD-dependent DNA ligase
MALTTVTNIDWNIGHDGDLHPIVHVEPINLDRCQISRVWGRDENFIQTEGIGPGAIIKIKMAFGTIPYIDQVVEPLM